MPTSKSSFSQLASQATVLIERSKGQIPELARDNLRKEVVAKLKEMKRDHPGRFKLLGLSSQQLKRLATPHDHESWNILYSHTPQLPHTPNHLWLQSAIRELGEPDIWNKPIVEFLEKQRSASRFDFDTLNMIQHLLYFSGVKLTPKRVRLIYGWMKTPGARRKARGMKN